MQRKKGKLPNLLKSEDNLNCETAEYLSKEYCQLFLLI